MVVTPRDGPSTKTLPTSKGLRSSGRTLSPALPSMLTPSILCFRRIDEFCPSERRRKPQKFAVWFSATSLDGASFRGQFPEKPRQNRRLFVRDCPLRRAFPYHGHHGTGRSAHRTDQAAQDNRRLDARRRVSYTPYPRDRQNSRSS